MGAGLGSNLGDTWSYLLVYAAVPFVWGWHAVTWPVRAWRRRMGR